MEYKRNCVTVYAADNSIYYSFITQVIKHCSFQAKSNLEFLLTTQVKLQIFHIFVTVWATHAWFITTSMNQFTDIPASGQGQAFMKEVQASKFIS